MLANFEPIGEDIRTLFFSLRSRYPGMRLCGPLLEILECKLCTRPSVRPYLYIHIYIRTYVRTLISLFLLWSDVLQLVVTMCTLLFFMVTGVILLQHHGHTRHFVCTALRRGDLRFGMA